MWQDALKRCGLPVDGGELFEIWLNGSGAMRMDFNNISRYATMFNTPIRQVFPQVESRDAYMSGK